MTTLRETFDSLDRYSLKWRHYFPIYERYFARWVGQPVKILELGVFHGGSLQMWKRWLGPQAEVVGVDVDSRSVFVEDQIRVWTGHQEDDAFMESVVNEHGCFNIVIDDGGHIPWQVLTSLRFLYPRMAREGVYLVEDCDSFFDNTLWLAEVHRMYHELNAWQKHAPTDFTRNTLGIHLHEYVLVLERGPHVEPEMIQAGTKREER